MKMSPELPDAEWKLQLQNRKEEAARRMLLDDLKKGFITVKQMHIIKGFKGCSEHEAEICALNGDLEEDLIKTLLKGV